METVGFKRVLNARLIFVCDTYIDYIERFTNNDIKSHGYAKIQSKWFTPGDLYTMMEKLKKAIKEDTLVNLLIERQAKKGSTSKQQVHYYLRKVD